MQLSLSMAGNDPTQKNQHNDISQFSNAYDPETGIPIYQIFEVIHVCRKNAFDISEEKKANIKLYKLLKA